MTLSRPIACSRVFALSSRRGWTVHTLASAATAPLLAISTALALLAVGTALALLATGCRKKEEAPRPPPGMADGMGHAITPTPAPPPEPPAPAPEPPTAYDFQRPGALDPGALSAPPKPSGPAPSAPVVAAPSAAAAPAGPDLAQELSAKLAETSGCVDVAQAATRPEGRLTISVTAYVQASGRVSRATVSAPGQPASALACIEKQVLSATLPGPIADAPAQVRGSTELQFKLVGAADAGASAPLAPAGRALNPNIARPAENSELAKPEPGEVAGPP